MSLILSKFTIAVFVLLAIFSTMIAKNEIPEWVQKYQKGKPIKKASEYYFGIGVSNKSKADADYILRGKILESDNGMYLILNLKDLQNGTEDSNQLFVNAITCETIGWEKIRPENLKQALQNNLQFNMKL